MTILYIFISIFFLNFLIFIHELFHLLAAKILKIKAVEFAVGMGPSLFAFQKQPNKLVWKFLQKKEDGTLNEDHMSYHIRLIPLGGYVSFGKEKDGVIEDGLIIHKPWKRILVAFAGPLGNLIFAVVLMAILLLSSNYTGPGILVNGVNVDSFAERSGIQANDALIELNQTPLHSSADFSKELLSSDETCFVLLRDGKEHPLCGTFLPDEERALGIYYKQNTSVLAVIPKSVEAIYSVTSEYIKQFVRVIYGFQVKELSGPIGIVDTMQENLISFERFVTILILINIALGIGNLLFPFSITDGGRILIDFLAIIVRKHALPTKYLDFFSVVLMVLLFLTTTFLDLSRLFQ